MATNESFQVAAANVGRPGTIALLATLPPSAQALVTEQTLLAATETLLELYPLLRCVVVDGRTATPSWQARDSLSAEDVLERGADSAATASDAAILEELVNLGTYFNGTRGPLWRVIWYAGAETRVGLSIGHALTDGSGARNLMCDLLKLLREPLPRPATGPARAKVELPPTFDSTVNNKLTARVVLGLVWGMARAKIWSFLHSSVQRSVPARFPLDHSLTRCALVRLTAAEVSALKAFAKQHGVMTLHPLIKGAVFTAAFTSTSSPLAEGVVSGINAYDFREPALGHARCSGNHTGAHWGSYHLTRATSLASWCAAYERTLRDPKTRRRALERSNASELVPSPRKGAWFELDGKQYPLHAKEAFLLDEAAGKGSYKMDIGTSNLMKMDPTGWEVEEGFTLVGGKNAGVAYAALVVTVVSDARDEMALAVSWQESNLERGNYARRVAAQLGRVLRAVAAGEVDARTTMGSFGCGGGDQDK